MIRRREGSFPRALGALTGALAVGVLTACGPGETLNPEADLVFYGARIFDGVGEALSEGPMVLQAAGGRILSLTPMAASSDVAAEAAAAGVQAVDVTGKFIVPGLINAHGHAGSAFDPDAGIELSVFVGAQLERYARYGVTTVNSLGGDTEASVSLRDASWSEGGQTHARLLIAGEPVAAPTAEEALAMVDGNEALGADWIKGRMDDNLGTIDKMPMDVAREVIERAHELGYPVAFHLYYLDDAKSLLEMGVDLVAHSIRDADVDQEVIQLFKDTEKCYVPTLTREVSTFIYSDRPDFFDDPFLMDDVATEQVVAVSNPDSRDAVGRSPAAAAYRDGLVIASRNMKALADAGVPIAFGTDTGPLGRFQGYFEHMEMSMMEAAGLSPVQVLQSATGTAAWCLGLDDVGILEAGRRADLVIMEANPTAAIGNMRTIDGVWIGGTLVPGSDKTP